jgi:hypothetical protein
VVDHLHVLDPRRRGIVHELSARDGGVIDATLLRFGVAPVDQAVFAKSRIERDIQQSALAARIDSGKPRDRRR